MDLLVIGGGRFLGRHLVDRALARGDRVTVFNRGRASSTWPAGVTALVGDRAGDLAALDTGRWDAVVDTCGYLPGDTGALAAHLAPRCAVYAFVSSVSVYADSRAPRHEGDPVGTIDDPDTTVVDGRTYGPLKALCEAAVARAFGSHRTLIVRPGLIVGPHDPTQRFTHWPVRHARAAAEQAGGGPLAPMLAPAPADGPVQCIDARDLAAWTLDALAQGTRGVFNATSPPDTWTWRDLLAACAQAAGATPPVLWATPAELADAGVAPWSDLPLALPADEDHAHFLRVPTAAAQAAGLRCRPLPDTVRETLAWWQGLAAGDQAALAARAGLDAAREAQAVARIVAARAGG
jgi:2'-hydroxyisoflavone reductase